MTRSSVLVLALALTACSHGTGAGTTANAVDHVPELPLPSLVDPNAIGALHLDFSRIQSSPVYSTAVGWIDLLSEDPRTSDDARLLTQMVHARDSILFLDAPANEEPSAVLLLRGHFDPGDLDRLAQQGGATPAQAGSVGPFPVRSVGDDGEVSMIGNHTMVLGRRRAVEAVLERQLAGGNGSYPHGEAFNALASRVEFGTMPIALAVVPTEAMRATGANESDPFLAALAGSNGLAFGFDLSDGLRGKLVANLGSSIEAMGLVTLARMQLGRIAQTPDVAETGLDLLLPLLQLDRDGSTVIASLAAPADTTARALGVLDRFVRQLAASH